MNKDIRRPEKLPARTTRQKSSATVSTKPAAQERRTSQRPKKDRVIRDASETPSMTSKKPPLTEAKRTPTAKKRSTRQEASSQMSVAEKSRGSVRQESLNHGESTGKASRGKSQSVRKNAEAGQNTKKSKVKLVQAAKPRTRGDLTSKRSPVPLISPKPASEVQEPLTPPPRKIEEMSASSEKELVAPNNGEATGPQYMEDEDMLNLEDDSDEQMDHEATPKESGAKIMFGLGDSSINSEQGAPNHFGATTGSKIEETVNNPDQVKEDEEKNEGQIMTSSVEHKPKAFPPQSPSTPPARQPHIPEQSFKTPSPTKERRYQGSPPENGSKARLNPEDEEEKSLATSAAKKLLETEERMASQLEPMSQKNTLNCKQLNLPQEPAKKSPFPNWEANLAVFSKMRPSPGGTLLSAEKSKAQLQKSQFSPFKNSPVKTTTALGLVQQPGRAIFSMGGPMKGSQFMPSRKSYKDDDVMIDSKRPKASSPDKQSYRFNSPVPNKKHLALSQRGTPVQSVNSDSRKLGLFPNLGARLNDENFNPNGLYAQVNDKQSNVSFVKPSPRVGHQGPPSVVRTPGKGRFPIDIQEDRFGSGRAYQGKQYQTKLSKGSTIYSNFKINHNSIPRQPAKSGQPDANISQHHSFNISPLNRDKKPFEEDPSISNFAKPAHVSMGQFGSNFNFMPGFPMNPMMPPMVMPGSAFAYPGTKKDDSQNSPDFGTRRNTERKHKSSRKDLRKRSKKKLMKHRQIHHFESGQKYRRVDPMNDDVPFKASQPHDFPTIVRVGGGSSQSTENNLQFKSRLDQHRMDNLSASNFSTIKKASNLKPSSGFKLMKISDFKLGDEKSDEEAQRQVNSSAETLKNTQQIKLISPQKSKTSEKTDPPYSNHILSRKKHRFSPSSNDHDPVSSYETYSDEDGEEEGSELTSDSEFEKKSSYDPTNPAKYQRFMLDKYGVMFSQVSPEQMGSWMQAFENFTKMQTKAYEHQHSQHMKGCQISCTCGLLKPVEKFAADSPNKKSEKSGAGSEHNSGQQVNININPQINITSQNYMTPSGYPENFQMPGMFMQNPASFGGIQGMGVFAPNFSPFYNQFSEASPQFNFPNQAPSAQTGPQPFKDDKPPSPEQEALARQKKAVRPKKASSGSVCKLGKRKAAWESREASNLDVIDEEGPIQVNQFDENAIMDTPSNVRPADKVSSKKQLRSQSKRKSDAKQSKQNLVLNSCSKIKAEKKRTLQEEGWASEAGSYDGQEMVIKKDSVKKQKGNSLKKVPKNSMLQISVQESFNPNSCIDNNEDLFDKPDEPVITPEKVAAKGRQVTLAKTMNTTGGSGSGRHHDSNMKDHYQYRTPSTVEKKLKVYNSTSKNGQPIQQIAGTAEKVNLTAFPQVAKKSSQVFEDKVGSFDFPEFAQPEERKKQQRSNKKVVAPSAFRMSNQDKEILNKKNEENIRLMTEKVIAETITQEELFKRIEAQEPRVNCMGCKCKSTKCLKLYCECLRNKATCGPYCQCKNNPGSECHNNLEHAAERKKAIEDILKRNIEAFEDKVVEDKSQHFKGCKCRASQCQKNYCECYERGVPCNPQKCKCVNCKNHTCHKDHVNNPANRAVAQEVETSQLPLAEPVAEEVQ